MEKKKKIVIIASIAVTLLLLIGASYAYFTISINKENEENKKVEVTTSALARATMEMGSKITAEGVLPGYKTVKTVRVYGRGPEGSKPLNATIKLTPNVVDFGNHIEYEVYALDNPNSIDANNICSESKKQSNNNQYYDEMTCDTINLGEKVTSGVFNEEEPVGIEIEVTSKTDKTYYILVKYVNDEENPQDNEQGKRFTIDIDFGTEIEEKEPNAADYITELAKTSSEIVDDETTDHNLRYIGKNPNNYVQFNGELWRIIGVMNDVEDEAGIIEPRIKLRRSWNLGPAYSWDYKSDGSYAGDWTTSTLMKLLNEGSYYNRTSGIYYNYVEGQDPTPTNLYLSGDGLTVEAKSMISKVKWKLGGSSTYDNVTTSMFYTSEKGTEVYNGRSTEWIGKVGLIYPSDYGYATSGGSTVNRASCLENLWKWNDSEHSDCRRNNWMYRSVTGQWTMTSHTLNSSLVFSMSSTGEIHSDFVYFASNEFYPVVYLSTDAKIKSGTGTYDDPYILSL